MPATKTQNQGKTSFVKEVLIDNPTANPKAVNDAWKAAGMEGTISETLVNKQRAAMGLSGNLRGTQRTKKSSKARSTRSARPQKRARKSKQATVEMKENSTGAKRGRPMARAGRLAEIEADLDRLLYRVMDVGQLSDVEDALRLARRRLYGAFASKR
jgi:hypothetical protein